MKVEMLSDDEVRKIKQQAKLEMLKDIEYIEEQLEQSQYHESLIARMRMNVKALLL